MITFDSTQFLEEATKLLAARLARQAYIKRTCNSIPIVELEVELVNIARVKFQEAWLATQLSSDRNSVRHWVKASAESKIRTLTSDQDIVDEVMEEVETQAWSSLPWPNHEIV